MFHWPVPFSSGQTNNPDYNAVNPTAGGMEDTHGLPSLNFTGPPYFQTYFTTTQNYQFSCGCYNSGQWQNLNSTTLSINRYIWVYPTYPQGQAWYQVCKNNLPPASNPNNNGVSAGTSCALYQIQ
jgi:hypothetical protein